MYNWCKLSWKTRDPRESIKNNLTGTFFGKSSGFMMYTLIKTLWPGLYRGLSVSMKEIVPLRTVFILIPCLQPTIWSWRHQSENHPWWYRYHCFIGKNITRLQMTISANVQSSFTSNIFRSKKTNRPTLGDFCGGGSNHMTTNFEFSFHMNWFFIIKYFHTFMVFILTQVYAA